VVTEYVSMNPLTDKRLDEDGDQVCHHLEDLKSIFFDKYRRNDTFK
jgi:hypothetical protein